MSIRVLASAWRTRCASHTQKLILLNLADHANDCGVCWPSTKRIAEQCGLSRQTVISQLKGMEAAGLIAVTRTGGGLKNPNRYRLIVEELKVLNRFEVFRPGKRSNSSGHETVQSTRANGPTALDTKRSNSSGHEPSVTTNRTPNPGGGSSLARRGEENKTALASFWETTKRLELVEREIKAIEDRASVCAMDTIIEPQDREKFRKLREQRRELKKALSL